MTLPVLPSQLGTLALAGATAWALAAVLTPLVRATAIRFGWVSSTTESRWSKRATARLGGIAIFVSFIAASLAWVPATVRLPGLLVGSALVFALGLVDDLRRLPPYAKLVAQLLIGCVIVMGGTRFELATWTWLTIPLSILWFVGVMNAFNLLDNMDGLAAGIGAIAAGFCAFHAGLAASWDIAALNVILCGACVGFLRSNFPPAKIYMGDSGSHFLGLALAILTILGASQHRAQLLSVLIVPVLVLAVPIFDMCFVTIQRLAHRLHPFIGGRDHVSHRLAILGLSTRQTVLVLYGISIGLGFLSVVSRTLKPAPAAIIWLTACVGLVLFGRYLAQVNVYRLEPSGTGDRSLLPAPSTTRIETMLLYKRRLLEILVDFALLSSAYVVAHLLRFEGTLPGEYEARILQSLPVLLAVKVSCFAGFGLYRGVWRYLGLEDLIAVVKAVTWGSILSSLALLYVWRFEGYSRAVFIIDWMLTLLAVSGARMAERLLDAWIARAAAQGTPVLLVGAGDTGERVLRSLRYDARQRRPVAFLDDDLGKQGTRIHGVEVLGGRRRLPELLARERISEVLIAISDPPGELLEYIRSCCEPHGVAWRVVTAGVTDAV